ncbi:hypothetical protein VTI28DRAFT_924 [Corynascus sepedonium]
MASLEAPQPILLSGLWYFFLFCEQPKFQARIPANSAATCGTASWLENSFIRRR